MFDPTDLEVDLSGRHILVTGANSGLGFATARQLGELGGIIHLLCRNPERGERACLQLRDEVPEAHFELHIVDMSEMDTITECVDGLGALPVYALVHNAGLLPDTRMLNSDGVELTVATHLVGPDYLTSLLLPNLRKAVAQYGEARVLFVSSGGMYTQRFSMKSLANLSGSYNGVKAYARTKRAQVLLTEQLSSELATSGIAVNCMHPGWAATPGVQSSLPGFSKMMSSRLRSAEQGADTIIWLTAAAHLKGKTGRFWFDRREVSTHLLPHTRGGDKSAHLLRPQLRSWRQQEIPLDANR
ncbi:MAG: SDR family NAD(P)-dependent oxidoreductase [Bradymonadia bacterium]